MRFINLFFVSGIALIFTSLSIPDHSSEKTSIRDQTRTDELIVESPTLRCAGFEWVIYGDENRNAEVLVAFRRYGTEEWKEALPLLRIGGEHVYGHDQRWDYRVADLFAGSIFNLLPGEKYECRFQLRDPDGVIGETEKQVIVETKKAPKPYEYGQVYHVYPPGYEGPKETPAFTGLNEAYYGEGNLGDWWLVPEPRVKPGDVILIHGGVYQGDPLDYVDPLALNFHGAYVLTQKGTPDKPIAIKAAGDGEVIFDGAGAYRLFDVMAADYHYFEGLTIRNVDIAFYAGLKRVMGSSGLSVVKCKMEDIGVGVMTHSADSKDFYIADNVFKGRHDPDTLVGWYGLEHPSPLTSYYAVKVYGKGHVICHNRISFFHDAICIDTHGLPEGPDKKCVSIDIYNNDLFNMSDDFIESDGSVHNVRIFDNRGFNSYHAGLSAQPVFGGPVYFIRNIIYHVPSISLKFMIRPAGLYVLHNTFCAETGITGFSNGHFRNNLFMGHDDERPVFSGATFTRYSTLDYDGFRKKEKLTDAYIWRYPADERMNHADASELVAVRAGSLKEFTNKTGYEMHGIELDYDAFNNVLKPDPLRKGHIYPKEGYDFNLRKGSPAVDAGIFLPNINDNYQGEAPDMGALEQGAPPVYYGPRSGN